MKKFIVITLFLLVLLPVLLAGETVWHDNLDNALDLAKKQNKPILIDFTGSDWCGWCIKLDKEVFSKKDFQKYADTNLILVKLDFPKDIKQTDEMKKTNRALAEKYKVQGFPTIILLNSKGENVAQTGYQEGGAAKYVTHLKDLLKKK